MSRTCDTCRFFYPFEPEEDGHVRRGWCERFPPTYTGMPNGIDSDFLDVMDPYCWSKPVVGIKSYCGEWRKKKHGKDGFDGR